MEPSSTEKVRSLITCRPEKLRTRFLTSSNAIKLIPSIEE
jgi:hypothetical protein